MDVRDLAARLIAFIAGTALIVMFIVLLIWLISNIFTINTICNGRNNVSQQCIDYRMQNCLDTKLYSRDECIILTSGE